MCTASLSGLKKYHWCYSLWSVCITRSPSNSGVTRTYTLTEWLPKPQVRLGCEYECILTHTPKEMMREAIRAMHAYSEVRLIVVSEVYCHCQVRAQT